jgi:hypothetical protein
MVCLDVT